MRTRNCKLATVAGALVLAMTMVPGAMAQCGLNKNYVKPTAWHSQPGSAHFMHAALFDDDDRDGPSIVGLWHVVFTAETMGGNPIPKPYPNIDNALVVFHGDKTEIMESARPPQDGNFCLGVWEKTGEHTYYVNHLPWLGNDTTNAPSGIGEPTGGAQITEHVILSEDGNHYSGTFTLTAYNTNGTVAVSFTGVLSGTRVTTSTPFSSLL
jgi:hypothetical protein